MNIYLTLDYELYLGNQTGSVDNCIIKPTNEILRISKKYNVFFTFFVDATYIFRLNQLKGDHKKLQNDYKQITSQLKDIVSSGNGVQLHIHPHWIKSNYDGHKWELNYNAYKLSSFSQTEINSIIVKSKELLEEITKTKISAFRAGGFSIQPFTNVSKIFKKLGIKIDSSVFSNEKYESKYQSYDYTKIPDKSEWNFESDICIENNKGYFKELPISTVKLNPFFYWKLAFVKFLNNYSLHDDFGDGNSISNSSTNYFEKLTSFSNGLASFDGYKASYLEDALKQIKMKEFSNFVVISHPKSVSPYSLNKLEKFIQKNIYNSTFKLIGEAI